jgi:DNA-binding NtrC family response regulator
LPKILIVEDEFNTRAGLSERLTEEGYEVEAAEDGAAALEKIDLSIDLLLSDLRLPDVSGIHLSKKLKQMYPGLLTIIMTAYTSPDFYQEAQNAGVFGWLNKPIDLELLLSIIGEALEPLNLSKRKAKVPMNYF